VPGNRQRDGKHDLKMLRVLYVPGTVYGYPPHWIVELQLPDFPVRRCESFEMARNYAWWFLQHGWKEYEWSKKETKC
jgi:hypothetical protein